MFKTYKITGYYIIAICISIGLTSVWLKTSVFAAPTTLHYAANTSSTLSQAVSNGFNMVDVAGSNSNPSTTTATVNSLPSGVQALVWVGNLDNAPLGSSCPPPGFTDAQFKNLVGALANNPKVYGYYVSDEPHPKVCSTAASDIATRADYVRQVAPGQKTFITVLDGSNMCVTSLGCEYAALNPSNTHVDYIGLDPYLCHYSGTTPVPCDNSVILSRFNSAVSNGIPASAVVPVFQTFGQEGRSDGGSIYYRTPSASELQSMLDTWSSLVPYPAFDYSYTWGVQCSATSCPAAQALENHTELQAVIGGHNASKTTMTIPSPVPAPTTSTTTPIILASPPPTSTSTATKSVQSEPKPSETPKNKQLTTTTVLTPTSSIHNTAKIAYKPQNHWLLFSMATLICLGAGALYYQLWRRAKTK